MSQDRRYARGAEDAQEFITRALEKAAFMVPSSATALRALAVLARSFTPEKIRAEMERDPAWLQTVAERETERIRAGWRQRSLPYYERQRRHVTGDDLPTSRRNPKRKGR